MMKLKRFFTFLLAIAAVPAVHAQCDAGRVSTLSGDTLVYTCPGDSMPDLLVFTHTADTASSFTFVVTDANDVILAFPPTDTVDFEGAGEGLCKLWGLAYTDTLRAQVGDTLGSVSLSDSCADLSDNFVTVVRAVPDAGVVSTSDGQSELDLCLTDTLPDVVSFVANGQSAARYTLLVTDTANVILTVPTGMRVDFSSAGPGVCRVWGLSYTGTLSANAGDTASVVALSDDCFALSAGFVNIRRDTACADTTPPPPPPPSGPFTLINADSDMELTAFGDGDSIDVSQFSIAFIDHLNVRYEPDTGFSPIGSVVFDFDGVPAFNIEQIVPYALGGDDNGNYHPVGNAMTLGTHTLAATPYSSYQGMGTAGPGDTITFTLYESGNVPPDSGMAGEVVNFTLLDADAEQDIRNLADGDTIDLSALASPNISIRANTNPQVVGSVKFDFNGVNGFRVENVYPYMLGGDIQPDHWPVEMPDGDYTLTATPYSAPQAGGTAGTPQTIHFTVISSPFQRVAVSADHSQLLAFPNPAGEQVQLEMPQGRRGPVRIQVVSPMGNVMLREQFVSPTDHWNRVLDTQQLPPGVYIVHITNGMFRRTLRLVKR